MRKKHSKKVFKTTREMDHYLETHDLGEIFKKKGVCFPSTPPEALDPRTSTTRIRASKKIKTPPH